MADSPNEPTSAPKRGSAVVSAPFVTVVIPCLDEEARIEACLRCVTDQDYPTDRMEILVADGMSMDATREIVTRVAEEDPRVTIVDNPDRLSAAGMNRAIRASRGDVVVRVDVGCDYARDYVRRCVEALQRTGADNAGGAQRTRAKTLFQKALSAAFESPLVAGDARYHDARSEGFVDTVFLGAFRREIFDTVGFYDPKAITDEDAELNQRIVAAGGKVYQSSDIVVHSYPRGSFPALAKHYFRSGKARARTFLKHRKLPSVRPALPFFGVTAAVALLATSPWQPATPIAFGGYALATLGEAIRVGRRAGALAVPIVWGILPVVHASHGAGFAVGLVAYAIKRDWSKGRETLGSMHAPYTDAPDFAAAAAGK